LLNGDWIKFFKGFIKHPAAVGAIAPSSRHLASEMLRRIDWNQSTAIAEIGPGTGPFTQAILDRCGKSTRFFAVEIDPQFVSHLKQRFPLADIAQADASELKALCMERQISQLDALVSGLPWAVFPEDLQRKILDAILDSLVPNGRFSTFAYLHGLPLPAGQRFRRLLKKNFRSVETSPILWRNLPPAIVYHCQK
jgi:phosphatidylethanolamine/phosphatidyl-N-methylethanolamine N-methyltransferase